MLPRKILPWSALALLAAALLPAPAAAQPSSGVAVKQDGDALVLIPQDPGKAYLVLGYPRDEKSQKQDGVSRGPFPYLVGEQRIPAKEYSKIVVLEVRQIAEVEIPLGPSGLQVVDRPCKPGTCDKPLPPWPPVVIPVTLGYLVRDKP